MGDDVSGIDGWLEGTLGFRMIGTDVEGSGGGGGASWEWGSVGGGMVLTGGGAESEALDVSDEDVLDADDVAGVDVLDADDVAGVNVLDADDVAGVDVLDADDVAGVDEGALKWHRWAHVVVPLSSHLTWSVPVGLSPTVVYSSYKESLLQYTQVRLFSSV